MDVAEADLVDPSGYDYKGDLVVSVSLACHFTLRKSFERRFLGAIVGSGE